MCTFRTYLEERNVVYSSDKLTNVVYNSDKITNVNRERITSKIYMHTISNRSVAL